jgi:hypothetical protein
VRDVTFRCTGNVVLASARRVGLVLRLAMVAFAVVLCCGTVLRGQNACTDVKPGAFCLDQPQSGDTKISGQADKGSVDIKVNETVYRKVKVTGHKFSQTVPALGADLTVMATPSGSSFTPPGLTVGGHGLCETNSNTLCVESPEIGKNAVTVKAGATEIPADRYTLYLNKGTAGAQAIPLDSISAKGSSAVAVRPLTEYDKVELDDKLNPQAPTAGPLKTQKAKVSTACSEKTAKLPCLSPVSTADRSVTGYAVIGSTIDVKLDQIDKGHPTVDPDTGKFSSDLPSLTKGQTITATQLTPPPAEGSKPASATVAAPAPAASTGDTSSQSKTTVVLIGGWEQAGYSSLAQYGNPFVNVFIDGPSSHILTGWGRVRLLSAPQPSTQGIVSTFTNPTGQLTTQSYAQVGQALDYVIGPEFRIPHSYWSVIADFGATTPFSSQNVALTYVAPAPGTVECTTLVNRFSAQKGYSPGLVAAPPGSTTCLQGGYTDVAFSNQDRSNFLLKYGGGFRTSYPFTCTGGTVAKPCSNSYGILDLTFGQDEAVTGGYLRSVVFKIDGVLPIPLGNASWIYVFGSAYMRLNGNQNLSPLILQTATGVTIPAPTVIVLPLRQPNRDYYRLGVGINLSQIFCQLSASGCPNKSTGSATSNQSATSKNPTAAP